LAKVHSNFERTDHWDAEGVVRTVEDSLCALQTDYIDLLQFHSGSDEVFDNETMWAALHGLIQSGKVRHLGLSIGSNANIYQTSRSKQVKSEAIQVIYNRLTAPLEAGSCLPARSRTWACWRARPGPAVS
jgi:aryl-alcohol dehydrogenase-like predicted oxidoreductase